MLVFPIRWIADGTERTRSERFDEWPTFGNREASPYAGTLGPRIAKLVRLPYVCRCPKPMAQQADRILKSPPNWTATNDEAKARTDYFETFENLARLTILRQRELSAGRSGKNAMHAVARQPQPPNVLSWQSDPTNIVAGCNVRLGPRTTASAQVEDDALRSLQPCERAWTGITHVARAGNTAMATSGITYVRSAGNTSMPRHGNAKPALHCRPNEPRAKSIRPGTTRTTTSELSSFSIRQPNRKYRTPSTVPLLFLAAHDLSASFAEPSKPSVPSNR